MTAPSLLLILVVKMCKIKNVLSKTCALDSSQWESRSILRLCQSVCVCVCVRVQQLYAWGSSEVSRQLPLSQSDSQQLQITCQQYGPQSFCLPGRWHVLAYSVWMHNVAATSWWWALTSQRSLNKSTFDSYLFCRVVIFRLCLTITGDKIIHRWRRAMCWLARATYLVWGAGYTHCIPLPWNLRMSSSHISSWSLLQMLPVTFSGVMIMKIVTLIYWKP